MQPKVAGLILYGLILQGSADMWTDLFLFPHTLRSFSSPPPSLSLPHTLSLFLSLSAPYQVFRVVLSRAHKRRSTNTDTHDCVDGQFTPVWNHIDGPHV